MEMGHSDRIVISDGNFPAESVGKNAIVIRADGHGVPELLDAILKLMPLDEYVPLYSSDKGVATQFNMTTIEELGLLKMDFLGLRNLTIIRDALEMIEENHGVKIDFSKMDYDDPNEGKYTVGIIAEIPSGKIADFKVVLSPDEK